LSFWRTKSNWRSMMKITRG